MNLSKKLLLALAGTGLMVPMAASAQELASLSGTAAINEYMQQQDVDRFRAWESKNQVTSITQFSDVQPTDSVTARKDDAPAADQAAMANVAGWCSISVGGGLIQTTCG